MVAKSGTSPTYQNTAEIVAYVETANTSHTSGLRNCDQTPMLLGYGNIQYANQGPGSGLAGSASPVAHSRFPTDAQAAQEILANVDGLIDLAEPFLRIREAISEARKMGVTGRAA